MMYVNPVIIDTPDAELLEKFMSASVKVARYVDIYESDNITLWRSQVPMTHGAVNADMNRSERRNVSLTLWDGDDELGYGPNGGLWYDKILKPYRGIVLPEQQILTEGYVQFPGANNYIHLTQNLSADASVDWRIEMVRPPIGDLTTHHEMTNFPTYIRMSSTGAEIFILTSDALFPSVSLSWAALDAIPGFPAENAWFQIRGVWDATIDTLFLYWRVAGQDLDDDAGWNLADSGVHAGKQIYVGPEEWSLGGVGADGALSKVRRIIRRMNGGVVVDVNATTDFDDDQATSFIATSGQTVTVVRAGSTPLRLVPSTYANETAYVCPQGEFMIDTIERPHFPSNMIVNGRDFTKKLKLSKFTTTTTFVATGQTIESLIQTIATNAGITKFQLAATGKTLTVPITFEKDSERWEAISKLAESIAHEVYFNRFGYMVLRPYVDPATISPTMSFGTGMDGVILQEPGIVVLPGTTDNLLTVPPYQLYQNFAGAGTGPLTVAGTGQTWLHWDINDHEMSIISDQMGAAGTPPSGQAAGYVDTRLYDKDGNPAPVTTIGCRFKVLSAGSTGDGVLALLAWTESASEFFPLAHPPNAHIHVVITETGWQFDVYEDIGPDTLDSGLLAAPLSADGTTQYECIVHVDRDAQTAYIELPDGTNSPTIGPDPRLATILGTYAGYEVVDVNPTDHRFRFDEVWADSQATLSFSDDLTVIALATPDDYSPAAPGAIASRGSFAAADFAWHSYLDPSGLLVLVTSPDGSSVGVVAASTVVLPVDSVGLGFTLDLDNGSTQNVTRFWYSMDGEIFTQLGADVVNAGVGVLFKGNADMEIGASGGGVLFDGRYRDLSVRSGIGPGGTIGGSEVFHFDGDVDLVDVDVSAPNFIASTGQNVSIHRSGSPTTELMIPSQILIPSTDGNLSSYTRKTGDDRMFNEVPVRGSGQNNGLVFGRARNEEPLSPTSISNIGVRTMPPIENPIVATNAEAQLIAQKILNVAGLESYDVSMNALMAPWLEVGDVVSFIPTEGVEDEPTTFLLTSLGIPFSLGTMTAGAKRVFLIPPQPGTFGYGTFGGGTFGNPDF